MYCVVPTLVVPSTKGKLLKIGDFLMLFTEDIVSPQATASAEMVVVPNLNANGGKLGEHKLQSMGGAAASSAIG